MKAPKQISLECKECWKDEDIKILNEIYLDINSKEEAIELWKTNTMVRVADAQDYEYIYKDLIVHENELDVTFDEFMREISKGYGNSKYNEISRLFELSNGIWYDNEFC